MAFSALIPAYDLMTTLLTRVGSFATKLEWMGIVIV